MESEGRPKRGIPIKAKNFLVVRVINKFSLNATPKAIAVKWFMMN
jgi:hypothetical protein